MSTRSNFNFNNPPKVSFETFGVSKDQGPSVLVIHALTGNATVAGEKGWWKELFGENKLFDTRKFHIIGINIPGNGYDDNFIENYKDFDSRIIADAIVQTLQIKGYETIAVGIGGSLGGGLLWDIIINHPTYIKTAIPIATDWKSNDWVKGFAHTQDLLLNTSDQPLELARQMAMFFYRNPKDFAYKFNNSFDTDKNEANVIGWLNHHGNRLKSRFTLSAYKMMNQLLGNIHATKEFETPELAFKQLQATIIQVVICSDILFSKFENLNTKKLLDQAGIENHYIEIESVHGHDAFLIEYEKLTNVLKKYIN
jgi:homoserine O-acetyltransferase